MHNQQPTKQSTSKQEFAIVTDKSLIEEIYTSTNYALTFFLKKGSTDEEQLNRECEALRRKGIQRDYHDYQRRCKETRDHRMGSILKPIFRQCSSWLWPQISGEESGRPDHDSLYHLPNRNDRFEPHYHSIKKDGTPFTPEEFNCIIEGIKSRDSKKLSPPLIQTADSVLLKEKYREYYENRFGKQEEPLPYSRQDLLSVFLIAFAYTFVSTLLQKSLQSLNSNNTQDILIKMVGAFILMGMIYSLTSSSVTAVILDLAQRCFLPSILEKMGVPKNMQDKISQTLAPAILLWPVVNEWSLSVLADIGINQAGAWLARETADRIAPSMPMRQK